MKTIISLLLTYMLLIPQAVRAEDVDLELVLAMDASGSISVAEYLLQLEGTAAAFRDQEIQAAIAAGPLGKIAVTVMLWSDARFEKPNSGWFIVQDAASAETFARTVRTFQLNDDQTLVLAGGGGTGIGAGVEEALTLLTTNQHRGDRRVIDVSGDGIETEFEFSKDIMIRDARILADQMGVTINGLPITRDDQNDLAGYYRDEVIIGPGSFVEEAKGFDDFARAFRKKLLREIGLQLAQREAGISVAAAY